MLADLPRSGLPVRDLRGRGGVGRRVGRRQLDARAPQVVLWQVQGGQKGVTKLLEIDFNGQSKNETNSSGLIPDTYYARSIF